MQKFYLFLICVAVALAVFCYFLIDQQGDEIERLHFVLENGEVTRESGNQRIVQLWAPEELLGIPDDYEPLFKSSDLAELIKTSHFVTLRGSQSRMDCFASKVEEFFPLGDNGASPPQLVKTTTAERAPDFQLTLIFQKLDGSKEYLWIDGGRIESPDRPSLDGMPLSYVRRCLAEASDASLVPSNQ